MRSQLDCLKANRSSRRRTIRWGDASIWFTRCALLQYFGSILSWSETIISRHEMVLEKPIWLNDFHNRIVFGRNDSEYLLVSYLPFNVEII